MPLSCLLFDFKIVPNIHVGLKIYFLGILSHFTVCETNFCFLPNPLLRHCSSPESLPLSLWLGWSARVWGRSWCPIGFGHFVDPTFLLLSVVVYLQALVRPQRLDRRYTVNGLRFTANNANRHVQSLCAGLRYKPDTTHQRHGTRGVDFWKLKCSIVSGYVLLGGPLWIKWTETFHLPDCLQNNIQQTFDAIGKFRDYCGKFI